MKKYILVIFLISFVGCASMACRSEEYGYCTPLYPGIGYDITQFSGTNPNDGTGGVFGATPRGLTITFHAIDFPFSLVLDTVALPIDIIRWSVNEERPNRCEYYSHAICKDSENADATN